MSSPPQLATTKIVKRTVWTRWTRSLFVASRGRISSIAAPVVPTNEARTPPTARKAVLLRGVALMSPSRWMPPETVKSAKSRTMNCAYSTPVAMRGEEPAPRNIHTVVGAPRARAMMSWLEARSHQCAVAGMIGRSAMQPSIATKGSRDHHW